MGKEVEEIGEVEIAWVNGPILNPSWLVAHEPQGHLGGRTLCQHILTENYLVAGWWVVMIRRRGVSGGVSVRKDSSCYRVVGGVDPVMWGR